MKKINCMLLFFMLLAVFIIASVVRVNADTAIKEINEQIKIPNPLIVKIKKTPSIKKPGNPSSEAEILGNNTQGNNTQGNNFKGNYFQDKNSPGTLKPGNRALSKKFPPKKVTAKSKPSGFFLNHATAFLPGQILLVTETTAIGKRAIREVKKKYGLEVLQKYFLKTLKLQVTKFHTDKEISSIIRELKQRPGVVVAQPNYIFKTMSESSDEPMNELQSIRKIIKIESDIPFKGKGVKIAIIDTGVDINHKDLKGAISFKSNCLQSSSYRSEIHGTAVAGLIGARKNNFGIVGYAPESKIFVLRACKQISKTQPRGECYSSSIAKALDLAILKKVHIINMSLGTNVKDKLISKLIYAGSKQGILFVAPTGNSSAVYKLCFPASHPKVISVSGITEKGNFFPNARVAKKSNFYLPCDNLFSTIPHNKHNFLSGTSLSSAVVSGLLALAHEKNKNMIIGQLRFFDGDMNKWVNKYLRSKTIATQKKK